MKIVVACFSGIMFTWCLAMAQNSTPGYYLIYGNRDGHAVDVSLDSDIEIQVWAATPAIGSGYEDINGDGIVDSIIFVHSPLASNNDQITARNGGEAYFPLDEWDYLEFTSPYPLSNPSGFTSQSLLGFAQLVGDPNIMLNTEGDTVLIATLFMHSSPDSANLGQTECAFMEGYDPNYYDLIWGLPDGITAVYPEQTFSCLYFVDYLAGDANGSEVLNGLDVIYLVAYFKGYGPAPDPILAGDANGDCVINTLDVSYLVAYFEGGPAPFLGDCH